MTSQSSDYWIEIGTNTKDGDSKSLDGGPCF